jgi:hypothetical protein
MSVLHLTDEERHLLTLRSIEFGGPNSIVCVSPLELLLAAATDAHAAWLNSGMRSRAEDAHMARLGVCLVTVQRALSEKRRP